MNGDPKAGARPEGRTAAEPTGPAAGPRGEVAALLLQDGIVTEAQVRHAERVREKLPARRPVVPLLLELGLLAPELLRQALRTHRLELRIGALLVELGHLQEADLLLALELQKEAEEEGKKLGEILVEHGLLGAQQLTEVLSSQLGVPCVEAGSLTPDPAIIGSVPLATCRRHRFLPLRSEGGRIVVAFADPLDKADAAAAQALFGVELAPWIATWSTLDEALCRLELSESVVSDAGSGERTAEQTAREILDAALRASASEIHVEPGPHRLVVRLRRDGVLCALRELPLALAAPLVRRFEIEAGVEAEDGARHREGWIRLEHEQRVFDLRASFLATACGESIVLRLRDPGRPALGLDALGLLPAMRRRLEEEALRAPGAVLLLAGPSGAGRTATLHACAMFAAGVDARVVTLEETLEVRLDGVSQNVLPVEAAPLLAERAALVLGQAPDVLAIDALREPGDLAVAFRAARSGPRVLAVLEAEDAVAALLLGVAAAGVNGHAPAALAGALAQRLVRRVCPACAVPATPTASELRSLGCTPVDLAGGAFRRGRGCTQCRETGYRGRIGLFELVLLDEAGRDDLRAGEGTAVLRRAAALCGPATLLEDGLVKAARGLTTLDELLRVVPRVARPRPLLEIERLLGEER